MGATQAREFASAVQDGTVALRRALEYHLFHNHFPPLPRGCVNVAMEVIPLAQDGEWDAIVALPENVGSHRRFGQRVPVREYVKMWHLDAFVGGSDDDDQ